MTRKVLITGAYGLVGNVVYGHLAQDPEAYDVYGTARRRHPSDRIIEDQVHEIPEDRFFLVDLVDWEGMQRAVQGMDVVVHMAADPSGMSGWDSVLDSNLIGAYHVFEACRLAGVKRVIFASSVQVNFGQRIKMPPRTELDRHVPFDPSSPVTRQQVTRPANLYAASKVWGEALAYVYANRHEMSCICVRIGWVTAEDRPPMDKFAWASRVWCSQRDIAQLVERCICAPPSLRFDVFYGISDNHVRFADIEHAREVVGYAPRDRAEDYADDQEGGRHVG
jgi:NAD+ dependent glucose-6-phosphate dehydrogenase